MGRLDWPAAALDPAGETNAILSFFTAMVEASATPKSKLRHDPGKRVEADGTRTRVRFKLASDDPGVSFECRIDSRKLRPCDPAPKFRVETGRHTFRFRALSERGRPGALRKFRFRVR